MSHRNVMFTIYSDTKKLELVVPGSDQYDEALLEEDNNSFVWEVPCDESKENDEIVLTYDSRIRYFVYQREQCPETGRHHYQGYIEFTKNLTVKQIQTLLAKPKCHIEKRNGTQAQAIEYCTKEDSRVFSELDDIEKFTYGVPSKGQGARTDIDKAKKDILTLSLSDIKSDTSVKTFAITNPAMYVKYHRGIEKLISFHRKDRTIKTIVTILWGASESGKSREAFSTGNRSKILKKVESVDDIFVKPDEAKWYDGYDCQKRAVFDEYDENKLPLGEFLKLCDQYPYQVQIKGGFLKFSAEEIVFTSNVDPREWYNFINSEKARAFQRRIDNVYHYEAPENGVWKEPTQDVNFHKPLVDGEFVPYSVLTRVNVREDNLEEIIP